jgi:tetratricopeptide (TPR) repeat protein
MKKNWIYVSLAASIVAILLTLFFTRNLIAVLLVGIFTFVIIVLANPIRRFMKAFWVLLSLIISLNKVTFKIFLSFNNGELEIAHPETASFVTVALIVLATVCLLLDYLERSHKLSQILFNRRTNKIGKISGNNNTITQIISPEGNDLSKNLDEFIKPLIQSKLNTIDNLKESLNNKDEIISLTKKNFELKIRIEDKQKELNSAEERYSSIFKEYNKKIPTNENSLYSKAMDFLLEGNESKALNILNKKNLESAIDEIDIDDSWLLRADLLKNKNNFSEELDECYDKIIEHDPSFRNNFLAGNYYYDKLFFKKAEKCFNDCLELSASNKEKVKVLIQLGNLYSSVEEFDEAEKKWSEALNIYRDFVDAGEKSFLKELAGTLNNLGNLHSTTTEFVKAERELIESLNIRRSLIVIKGKTNGVKLDIAATLNSLGTLYAEQSNFEKVEAFLIESLEIYQSLAIDEPDLVNHDLIMSLGNLATLYKNQSQYEKSEEKYNEAYDLLMESSTIKPRAFLQIKIDLLLNWSILLKNKTHYRESENRLSEALEIINSLFHLNEQIFRSKKALILTTLGDLYSAQNRNIEAEKCHNDAIEIVMQLKLENPKAHLFIFCNVLINSAIFFEKQNKIKLAENNYIKLLKLIEELNDTSEVYLNYIANSSFAPLI